MTARSLLLLLTLVVAAGCGAGDDADTDVPVVDPDDLDGDGIPFAEDCDDSTPDEFAYAATRLYFVGDDDGSFPLDELDAVDCATTSERFILMGSLWLDDIEGLESANALACLCGITGSLGLSNNKAMTSVSGLENLRFVWRDLYLQDNPNLVDLSGLDGLVTVGADLYVRDNSKLPLNGLRRLREGYGHAEFHHLLAPSGDSPAILGALTYVGGELEFFFNDFSTLAGLETVRQVGRLSIQSNDVLVDVDALSGVTEIASTLRINNNPNLSESAIDDLIDAIGVENVGGEIEISGNAP